MPTAFKRDLRERLLATKQPAPWQRLGRLASAAVPVLLLAGALALFLYAQRQFQPLIPPINENWRQPRSNDFELWGSTAQPLTDAEQIQVLLATIDHRLSADLTGAAGWVHLQDEVTVPLSLRPPGMMRALYPDETMTQVQWFEVDDAGNVLRSSSQFLDSSGQLRQESVFIAGQMVNLTLNQQFSPSGQVTLLLPTDVLQQGLNLAREAARPVKAMLVELDGQWVWRVVIDDVYPEASPLDQLEPGRTATAERVTFLFSWPDLRPLNRQLELLLDDDSWLTAEVTVHQVLAVRERPPDDVISLLERGLERVENGNVPIEPQPIVPEAVAEVPAAAEAMSEEARLGIIVAVEKVEVANGEAAVRLVMQAGPPWPLNPTAFPPEQILVYAAPPGTSNAPEAVGSFGENSGLDPESGAFVGRSRIVYRVSESEEKAFLSVFDIVVDGMFLPEPLVIDIAERSPNDRWRPELAFSVGPETLPVEEIVLLSRTDESVQIELIFGPLSSNHIEMQCLTVWDNSPESMGCRNYQGRLRANLLLDPENPDQTQPYRLKGSVAFTEPWVLEVVTD